MSSLSGNSQGVPENSQEPGPHQQNVEGVPAARSPLLNFDEARLVQHYHAGEYTQMSAQFLAVLTHFRDVTYYHLEDESQAAINRFVKQFLYYMT